MYSDYPNPVFPLALSSCLPSSFLTRPSFPSHTTIVWWVYRTGGFTSEYMTKDKNCSPLESPAIQQFSREGYPFESLSKP